jgi:hypothetical protein
MDYRKIYNKLTDKQRLNNRRKGSGIYYEAHHILPRSFGGKGDCRNINHPNIVLLTPKEHYIAHLLLTVIYPESPAMMKALWNMCNTRKDYRYKPSARSFEKIRMLYIQSVQGTGGSFYGKKHTSESLAKIGSASKGRQANLGKKHSEKTKKYLSDIAKQRVLSDETKEKISASISGGKHYNAKPIVCLKTGITFGSGKELSVYLNIPFSTIRSYLNGSSKKIPDSFHYKRV